MQSFCPKIDELQCILAMDHFDVVGINESWLEFCQRHLLAEVALPGYHLFSVEKPNPTGRRGGSVLYVRDSLNPIVKRKVSTLTCEVICLQVQMRDRKILKLVLVYSNPHTLAAEDDLLYDSLEEIMYSRFECVIFGDFNLPYIDWATKTAVARACD